MKIDISIVVLTYNQGKYITQTLQSILSQKTRYSFEIIVADDNSKDNTCSIIRDFEKKYECIHGLYNQNNLGVINNYINALHHCNGDYIMECGGDDYWLPEKIETQATYMLNKEDVGMSFGLAEVIDENGNRLNKTIGRCESATYEGLIKANSICASTACFKRALWNQYMNAVNPAKMDWRMEDYPFWLWISINNKIEYIDKKLACYRFVNGSITHKRSIEKQIDFEKSVYEVRLYYTKESNRENIWNTYQANLAQIYYNSCDIVGYRKSLHNSTSPIATMKLYLSYIPFYFRLRSLRRRITGKEIT